jgi:hypothetical protein
MEVWALVPVLSERSYISMLEYSILPLFLQFSSCILELFWRLWYFYTGIFLTAVVFLYWNCSDSCGIFILELFWWLWYFYTGIVLTAVVFLYLNCSDGCGIFILELFWRLWYFYTGIVLTAVVFLYYRKKFAVILLWICCPCHVSL